MHKIRKNKILQKSVYVINIAAVLRNRADFYNVF